jgi:hypothetical protein
MPKAPRRRFDTRDPESSQLIDALLDRAHQTHGLELGSESAESIREIMVTALRLAADKSPTGDLKLLTASLKELRHALRVFAPYEARRKVAVFGSARTKSDHPEWQQAHRFAERIVEEGWMVITGAGSGIMGAAQAGAGRDASFGLNIRLPFEQEANETIDGDPKLINFRYFFTRKVMFVKPSHAIALLPGGFGTHDEGFESLTLIQTGKSEIMPVVCLDVPGGSYWHDWDRYVRTHLAAPGLINESDLSLFKVTDDIEVAVHEVLNFYSNYHSSRFIRDRLLIRLREAPDAAQLDALNTRFGDIVTQGRIELVGAAEPEKDEAPGLPRIALRFDRRAVGRLRELIDEVNTWVPLSFSPPADACAHEIVPGQVPEDFEDVIW